MTADADDRMWAKRRGPIKHAKKKMCQVCECPKWRACNSTLTKEPLTTTQRSDMMTSVISQRIGVTARACIQLPLASGHSLLLPTFIKACP